jgi:hypothetical protein
MKSRFVAVISLTTLMACTPSTQATAPAKATAAVPSVVEPPSAIAPPPVDTLTVDTCNVAFYSGLIGKPVTDPGVPSLGDRDWTIGAVRIIEPGDEVTMNFDKERLNIDVDAAGVITGMRCG